jgi:hypothetical protein
MTALAKYHCIIIVIQVQAQLDASKVWKEFKDQRHDLFLARAPELPSLMGRLRL